jgi:hypothetical protein
MGQNYKSAIFLFGDVCSNSVMENGPSYDRIRGIRRWLVQEHSAVFCREDIANV